MKMMPSWFSRLFYPYRLLLLFSLVVCLIQILVGISFFHTISPQYTHNTTADTHSVASPPKPGSPPVVLDPLAKQIKDASLEIQHPDITVSCNITSREAVSAINRATTTQCKQSIVDLMCSLEKGSVYPKVLPRTCPNQVDHTLKGEHIGCYQDSFSKRLLQGHTVKLKTENSPSVCVDVCSKYGFAFAGVQYGLECFCGNSQPEAAREIQEKRCDMTCPGDEDETCGGYLTMDVFETGLKPLVPSKLGQANESEGGGSPVSPVRIVYLLTLSGRATRQVYRLINRIYSPNHYILVHVDARQEYMYREVSKLATVLPNLRMVRTRFSTIWGGASLLTMLLSALQELLSMWDWSDWDFVLNLSESDFPIKSQADLVTFLSNNRGSNFVKSHGREQDKFIKKQGLDKTFHECDTHMWRLGTRTLPLGVQIDGGSDWICLNREFAQYVVHSQDQLVTGLRTLFSYTLLPAESFFHTVLRNSRYCMTYIDNNLHLTNWKRKQGCKCQYKAIVDWCGCSPNDFLPEDWAKLEGTKQRQLFFARKFEPIIHQGIINRVEDWLQDKADEEGSLMVSMDSYWQNVFHYEDNKPSMDTAVISSLVSRVVSTSTFSSQCQSPLSLTRIQEITTYTHRDRFAGSLVHMETLHLLSSQPVYIELKLKYTQKHRQGLSKLGSRYLSMEVGTHFDPKELLFRNFLNLMDQDSKPSLRFSFIEGNTEIFHFGWLDPRGRLVATNTLQVNETSGTDSVTPTLPSPLEIGLWTVMAVLVQEKHPRLVAKEKFLVVPSSNQVRRVQSPVSVKDTKLEQYITVEDRAQPEMTTFSQAISALSDFYTLSDWCEDTPSSYTGVCSVTQCKDTYWSSKYPDPKSEVHGIRGGRR